MVRELGASISWDYNIRGTNMHCGIQTSPGVYEHSCALINSTLACDPQGDTTCDNPFFSSQFSLDSIILTEPADIGTFYSLLALKLINVMNISDFNLKLLYRNSKDGNSTQAFHNHCDGISNTLILVQSTEGCVFGGYTKLDWSLNSGYNYDDDAFLYRIYSASDNAARIFDHQIEPDRAVYIQDNYGPTFGGGHDFILQPKTHYYGRSYDTAGTDICGVSNTRTFFTFTDYEVFQVVNHTINPTDDPTQDPTIDPTRDPTVEPTKAPSNNPTTLAPTRKPSKSPTQEPTHNPTSDPTDDPTPAPTDNPTIDPTSDPTLDPTIDPTADPTNDPTIDPSIDPTAEPTLNPTKVWLYELILKQESHNYFGSLNAATLSNINDPSANLYSVIGTFDAAKQSLYRGNDNKFQFRLEYDNIDGTKDILIWKQSNWLLDEYVTDAEFIDVEYQASAIGGCGYFNGLALSDRVSTLLDGNGKNNCWYNAVGVITPYGAGIPAFDLKTAVGCRLYIISSLYTLYLSNIDDLHTCHIQIICSAHTGSYYGTNKSTNHTIHITNIQTIKIAIVCK